MQKAETFLSAIGLSEFSPHSLETFYHRLSERIEIGLHRSGFPTQEDGGVPAIRTGIPVLTEALWQKVSPGSEALVCAYGGTNWIIGHASKDEHSSICISEISKQPITMTERKLTFRKFIQLMATLLLAASKAHQLTHISTIGISFGFAHMSERVAYGIDAVLTSGKLAKGWRVSDWDQPEHRYVGKALMEELNASGELHIERIILVNDTCAVALDFGSVADYVRQSIPVLPVGIVCGTGTNACLGHQDELINLEIGISRYRQELQQDLILESMIAREIVSYPAILEYYTGGFLSLRLAVALQLLDEQGIFSQGKKLAETMLHADGALLSHLAAGNGHVQELRDCWNLPVEDSMIPLLQILAQRILRQAGQVYGVILAAVIHQARKGQTPSNQAVVVRVEGSAIHKGYQSKAIAQSTCEQLGERNFHIVRASGLAGVGSLAMSLGQLDR